MAILQTPNIGLIIDQPIIMRGVVVNDTTTSTQGTLFVLPLTLVGTIIGGDIVGANGRVFVETNGLTPPVVGSMLVTPSFLASTADGTATGITSILNQERRNNLDLTLPAGRSTVIVGDNLFGREVGSINSVTLDGTAITDFTFNSSLQTVTINEFLVTDTDRSIVINVQIDNTIFFNYTPADPTQPDEFFGPDVVGEKLYAIEQIRDLTSSQNLANSSYAVNLVNEAGAQVTGYPLEIPGPSEISGSAIIDGIFV